MGQMSIVAREAAVLEVRGSSDARFLTSSMALDEGREIAASTRLDP